MKTNELNIDLTNANDRFAAKAAVAMRALSVNSVWIGEYRHADTGLGSFYKYGIVADVTALEDAALVTVRAANGEVLDSVRVYTSTYPTWESFAINVIEVIIRLTREALDG